MRDQHFPALGDRFLSQLSVNARLQDNVVLVKNREDGYLVVVETTEDSLESIKSDFIQSLRDFAHREPCTYTTQAVTAGERQFLAVKIQAKEE